MSDALDGPTDEQFQLVDRLLDELMIKHFEMAQMCGEYRELIEGIQERPWDHDRKRLAGNLPGARYHVASTFAREQGLKIEAELKKMFPRPD
jgi:hypothetical protein